MELVATDAAVKVSDCLWPVQIADSTGVRSLRWLLRDSKTNVVQARVCTVQSGLLVWASVSKQTQEARQKETVFWVWQQQSSKDLFQ